MQNWKEYTLNGIEVTLNLDTKCHHWKIWIGSKFRQDGSLQYREPDLEFSKAKGSSIVEFLQELKEKQKSANSQEVSNLR